MNKRSRQLNLNRAATQLAQALRIVQDMMRNKHSEIFNVTDCPVGGIKVLEKLKLIEVFDHGNQSHMGDKSEQPRIVAIARS